MRFNKKYTEEIVKNLLNFMSDPEKYKGFSIEVPEGFATIPVIEIARAYGNITEFETREKITRLSILGKQVKIILEGQEVGAFIMNDMSDKFDGFPVLSQYPYALIVLFDICVGDMVKKSLPPLKNTGAMQAAKA
jgi:hypothetical protein